MMVELYTMDDCPWCEKAKKLLAFKKVEYVTYNISREPHSRAARIKRNPSYTKVPQTYVDDRFIGGYEELLKNSNLLF